MAHGERIIIKMHSTFHFDGEKILDQSIARDVNAFNAQLKLISARQAEALKEKRMVHVHRALQLFEDEDRTIEDHEAMRGLFDEEVTYMDPNEGGEFAGLDHENQKSVVSYLLKRKSLLSQEVVVIRGTEWRDTTLKVEWEREGLYCPLEDGETSPPMSPRSPQSCNSSPGVHVCSYTTHALDV